MATSDRANRTRLVVMAFGIALCAFALLAVATVNPLLNSVTARSYASNPAVVGTGPSFLAQRVSNPVDNGPVVTGTLLVGPADAAPPPGTDRFPQPGEVLVSPALATALADPANRDLRALVTGTIVGQIDPDVLVAPREWSYYLGVASLPAGTQPTTGWGAFTDFQKDFTVADVNPQLWAILLTGVAVLMIPLLLFVGMASRIGAAHRDRRSATLRLLGASQRQLRWIVMAEVGLASLIGLALAAAGYLTVRLLAPFVTVGGFGAQTEDIRPGLTATILIAVGVPVLAALSALTGSHRAAVTPLGPQTRPATRPVLWWRILLVAVTAIAIPSVLHEIEVSVSEVSPTVLLCGLVVLTILSVAAIVGPAAYGVAKLIDVGGPAVQLARGRILRYPGASTRPAAAVATILASVIALMSVLGLRFDVDPVTGQAYSRPYFGEVKDLSLADFRRLDADLHSVSGATSIVVMGKLPLSSSTDASALIATCEQIRELTDAADCSDGDTYGQIQTPVAGPGDLFTVNGSSSTWTTPADSRNTYVDVDPEYAANTYLLTPSVAAQIPDLGPIPQLQVGVFLAPGSLPAAREALTWLGPQSATVITYADIGSGVQTTYSWARTVLLTSAAFVLLICALAQWLLAAEYVTERRRAFALARASGIPLPVLTRAVLIGALFPVAVGALVAAGVGAVLAWTISTGRDGVSAALDTKWLVISCTTTLLVSLAVATGSAFQLRRTTRPTSLRTE